MRSLRAGGAAAAADRQHVCVGGSSCTASSSARSVRAAGGGRSSGVGSRCSGVRGWCNDGRCEAGGARGDRACNVHHQTAPPASARRRARCRRRPPRCCPRRPQRRARSRARWTAPAPQPPRTSARRRCAAGSAAGRAAGHASAAGSSVRVHRAAVRAGLYGWWQAGRCDPPAVSAIRARRAGRRAAYWASGAEARGQRTRARTTLRRAGWRRRQPRTRRGGPQPPRPASHNKLARGLAAAPAATGAARPRHRLGAAAAPPAPPARRARGVSAAAGRRRGAAAPRDATRMSARKLHARHAASMPRAQHTRLQQLRRVGDRAQRHRAGVKRQAHLPAKPRCDPLLRAPSAAAAAAQQPRGCGPLRQVTHRRGGEVKSLPRQALLRLRHRSRAAVGGYTPLGWLQRRWALQRRGRRAAATPLETRRRSPLGARGSALRAWAAGGRWGPGA
jgi:hypothetical protein